MRFAVISDIHAHGVRKDKPNASSIIFDEIKNKPISQNPLRSLIKLLDEESLKVDFLILPGDFCDHSDGAAFEYVWNELKTIGEKLGVKDIISTVGNHDVVRGDIDPFKIISHAIRTEFPFLNEKSANGQFWTRGFSLTNYPHSNADILVINSSFHHGSLAEVKNGKIDDDQLVDLSKMLDAELRNEFRVAVFHHHPIAHERYGSKTFDLMVNGSELLSLLDKFNFAIAVHGHKHDPRLKYSNSGAGSTAVFASGSFSCVPDLMVAGAYNTFHVIDLENKPVRNCEKQGQIKTWNFVPSRGWLCTNSGHLSSLSGFGCTLTPAELASQTFDILKQHSWHSATNRYIPMLWQDLVEHLPEIKYLMQGTFEAYGRICKEKFAIQFSTELPQRPEVIYLKA